MINIRIQIILFTLFCVIQMLFCQSNKIRGTYNYSNAEYIQINADSFRIIRTVKCLTCVDLNKGDSIISTGSVKYINKDFIELKSDPDSSYYKNISIFESFDSKIGDSLKISFTFPFRGKFKLEARTLDFPSKSTEKNEITIPKIKSYNISQVMYEIYNLDLRYDGHDGEYLGRIVFTAPSLYRISNEKTNFLQINIPNLTNSYYAHYVIDHEYIKVDKNKITWRNKEYKKISNKLISPHFNTGDNASSDPNGIDIIYKW